MGGGGSSAPAPQFNAQQASQDQYGSNVNTAVAQAYLNNTNQTTPYGNLTYNQIGSQNVNGVSVPQFQATQTLSPAEQAILNGQEGLKQGALGAATGLMGTIQNNINNGQMPDPNKVQSTAYDALMSRQNQNFDLQKSQLETSLKNQGIQPGTAAWDNAERPLQQSQTDAVNQATINASSLANNQLSNYQTAQNIPISEMSTLFGLGQGVTNPNLVNTPQTSIQPTDVMGAQLAAYQGQLGAYNQQLAMNQATMGGLFGMGGSMLGGLGMAGAMPGGFLGLAPLAAGSDIRMKENIRRVGKTEDGQNLYFFTYKGDTRPQIGLMAQEVERIKPDAVFEVNGLKYVDYGKALP